MSRRKQANPRPVKSVCSGRVGHGEEEEGGLVSPERENRLLNAQSPALFQEEEEEEEKALMIDTSFQNEEEEEAEPSNNSSSSLASPQMLLPPNLSSISNIEGESVPLPDDPLPSPSPNIPSSLFSPSSFVFIDNTHALKRGTKVNDELKILPVAGKDGENRFVCPVCKEEMKTLHDLTVHIRQHNTQAINSTSANRCTICGKVLSSQSSLDRHMLVHSGERPFSCRVCKMSFTTNGNMHRHMRIHSKEAEMGVIPGAKGGARRGKGGWRPRTPHRPIQDQNFNITESSARFKSETQTSFSYQPLSQPALELSPFSLTKRPLPEESHWENQQPVKKPMISNVSANNTSPSMNQHSHHSGHSAKPHKLFELPEKETRSEDKRLNCPICDKSMMLYELEKHVICHPCVPVVCLICQSSLPDPLTLLKHHLSLHPEVKDEAEPSTSCDDKSESEITVGFHDLDFVDFSCPKFSLVAKAWCERFSRQPSSMYHEFICKFCQKAFPCKSALLLHAPAHTDKQLTSCPFCDCEFVDQDITQTHMVKHMSERVIENCKATDPSCVSQKDYLAVFDLAPKQLVGGKEPQSKNIVKIEKRENNEYFPKLGHAYAPPPSRVPSLPVDNKTRIAKEVEDLKKFFPQAANSIFLNGGIQLSQLAALGFQFPHQLYPMPFLALPQQPSIHSPASSRSLTPPIAPASQADSPFPAASPASTPPLWDDGQPESDVKCKGVFPCKYCDVVFTNQRSLKGHIRTHLGLSPYKCNLCEYSSADKSTLIRHLRTHNGERPFQCLICDFAFTTKANCERHVRKKHAKAMKDEIDQSIGYNKYVMDTSTNMDSFHSPDTVCKYCGIDFKFFRALKHHLRSHSSCRLKPFLCRKCHIGFSTKANCVRHVQKQHLDVSQHHIEAMIHVNEPYVLDDLERAVSDSHDSVSPASLCSSSNFQVSPSPPAAHKVEPTSMLVKLEPISQPCRTPHDFGLGLAPFVSTPQSQDDQSLSFASTPGHSRGDQPMDLSVKKKSPSPSPPTDKSAQCQSSEDSRMKTKEHLSRFLQFSPTALDEFRKTHKQSDEILALSDDNNNDKKITGSDAMMKCENQSRSTHGVSLLSQFRTNLPVTGTESISDLASVKTILNNTGSHKFNMFLKQNSEADEDRMKTLRQHLLQKESEVEASPRDSPHPGFPSLESVPAESDVALLAQAYREDLEEEEEEEEEDEEEDDEKDESGFVDGGMNGSILATELEDEKELSNGLSMGSGLNTPVKKKRNSYADSPHKLRCPYCPRSFPWVSSLNRHLLTHTGQKPFKCPRCPVTFSTKSNRERHLIRKHGVNMLDPASRQTMDRPYKCHLCVFSSFSTESNLIKHYQERHNGVKPEPVADMDGFDNEDSNLDNMDNSFSDEDMSLCKVHDTMQNPSPAESASEEHSQPDMSDFNSFVQYQNKPELDFQGEGREDDENDDLDNSSNFKYDSSQRQINPERDNYNVDKITHCWKCGKSFPSRKILVRHLKEHNIDLPFKCYLCDASFDHRKDCLNHQERHHSRDWTILREKNGVENIEGFSTRMDHVVERHCRLGNGLLEDQDEEEIGDEPMETVTSDYNQRKVYCSLCPKRFWSLQDLRRHMRSHTGERPFECSVCHKRFTLKHSMMRHRKKHAVSGDMSPALSDDEESAHTEDVSSSSGHVRSALRLQLASNHRDSPISLVQDRQLPSMIPPMRAGVTESPNRDDDDDDILHNLLGVDESAINTMLDHADSAAAMLGVKLRAEHGHHPC